MLNETKGISRRNFLSGAALAGAALAGGLGLQKNHLYMATVDSRGVQASANSTKLLVRGNYSVQ